MAKTMVLRQNGDADLGFITARGLVAPVIPATTGTTYFVSSTLGNAANGGKSPTDALATIAGGLAKCTASVGDCVVVMPGHAESLSGAAALAIATAGVSIIGLGNGSNRPTLTLHTAPTTITVTAANVMLRNLIIKTDVDAVVTCFVVSAAGVTFDRVDFVETAACAALQFILTTAAADDLTIQDSRWIQTQTAATALQQWIVLIGTDRVKIVRCFASLKGYATSNPANGVVVGSTTAANDVEIGDNRFISTNSTGAIVLSLLASTTGFAYNNFLASAKTAIAGQAALAGAYGAENYVNNTANTNGLLDPVVDS